MTECRLPMPLRTPRIVREYAVRLCAQLGRRLDDACPIADASSEDGIRVHAVIAPLVAQGAAVTIRFPDRRLLGLTGLRDAGMFPPDWLTLLRNLVKNRARVLISGGTGSGKTTLLKALLAECDSLDRIVTVEEVRVLGDLGRDNHVSMVVRGANVEGAGEVGQPELVKATEEFADLLRAFNSGHLGGMTTLHADGIDRVPARLIALGMLAGLDAHTLTMLAEGAFDVMLHLERQHGRRRIAQIGCLGMRDGVLSGDVVALWDGEGAMMPCPRWQDFTGRWGM